MSRFRTPVLIAIVALGALLTMSLQRPAMRAQENPPAPIVGQAVHFAISPPIADLPPDDEVKPATPSEDKDIKQRPIKTFRPAGVDAGSGSQDGALWPPPGPHAPVQMAIPSPSLSLDGASSQDNANLFGSRVLPPDTVGDVGPNHYVQMVNSSYRIFDKTGAPLTPPRKLSSLFTALGAGNPCSTRDDGDPVVLYDTLADRWLLSQFCTVANPNNHQLIAISQTGDPTGAYYLYDFMMPNNKFNDYPKFGVWSDAYYMTDNQFNQAGTAFLGGGAFAFDRVKMLAGDPTATYIYFDLALLDPTIGGMLPSDMDGLTPPPAGTPGYFAEYRADEFGDPADALAVYEFHADFGSPLLSTFTQRPESPLTVPAFDPRSPTGRNDIEQPPPATSGMSLDSIQDRLLFRLAYRNFGGQESLVVNQTVNVGPNPTTQAGHQAAVRYHELRRSLPGGTFLVNEAATFAPDSDNRWMGSAAQDNQGNIAVGFSVSSTTVFPSVRYAGRLATDPPNGLFQGEASLVAGSGVQTHTSGRWGDYSAMSVDPSDDCTFWYTQEYYTAASQVSSAAGWLTRIGSFKFPVCTAAAQGTIAGSITNCTTGSPVPGAVVLATGGYLRTSSATGDYSMTVVPGTYDLTASKPGYMSAGASGLVVSNGATTTTSLCLLPIPILGAAGSTGPSAESCSPATGGLDPGETVTVSLAVRNTGAGDTTNLVGTLLSGGGVTSPGGPATYGVVLAGGPPVARSFTFTVDSALACGATLTATLSLQDGASNLGTVSYAFTLGSLSNGTFTATYSTGDIAVPIPDVNSVDIPITVPDGGSISDVNVRVRLDHTFDGDLVLSLINPDGTVVPLATNRGGAGDNYGSGPLDCSGVHTVFDDGASAAISGGIAPFTGSFRPEQPLSALNGKSSAGVWKLRVADTASLDVGTVGCVQLEVARRLPICCPFGTGAAAVEAAPGATIGAESCSPANGAVDPRETVTVNLPLRNVGTTPTSNLVATLLTGGGVLSPSGPQSYGSLSPIGPAVSRPFSFLSGGTCGGLITATLHLQDGATDLGNVTYTFGSGGLIASFSENFEGVTAPALPAGWTATVTGTTPPPAWATTTSAGFFVSPPNGAATGSTASVAESRLDSPAIAVPSGLSGQVSFQNNYSMETGFDGGVLEISISGGPFADIIAAGGSFVSGGYNQTISATFSSGIAGRMAWSGTGTAGSTGFITTRVNLPAAALGQNIVLRWRAAFDSSVSPAGAGWRIDDVSLSVFTCCGATVLAAPPATVTSESCGPANGVVDPDETVIVSFPLRNVGTTLTTNLVATLLPGGGVNTPGGPQAYGALVPGGAAVTRSFTFVPTGACGGTITALLHLQDGADDLGTASFVLTLGTTASITTSFSNTGAITIPSVGASTPYPSGITVSGVTGTVTKVTVKLTGYSHTFPDDVDLLLVGPAGDKFIIMSDVGGSPDAINLTLTLDDAGATILPDSGPLASGTFRPTNIGTGDTFALPAPAGPYLSPATAGTATFASVFNGKDPNGTWNLYVVDDVGGDSGSISGGWTVTITATSPVCCSQPCSLTCPADVSSPNDPGTCGTVVSYPPPSVSGTCGTLATAPPSGSSFPVGATTVTATATTSGGSTTTCGFTVTVQNTNPCDDGSACTTEDACQGATCVGGPPPNCDDNNACTVDSCQPATGCVHSGTAQDGHLTMASNFNGTPIPAGRWIWFNSNFKPDKTPDTLTTLTLTNSRVTFTSGGVSYNLAVPNARITLDPSATCSSTSFNAAMNRWETVVPLDGKDDETFLSGLGFPVPVNFPGGIKPVTWEGDVQSSEPSFKFKWKWSAAVYTTSLSDYNSLGVKPTHKETCLYDNSDHGGTPENKKPFVVGGARGGGGSNYTGGWSGSQSLRLFCEASHPMMIGAVTGLQFLDPDHLQWNATENATFYDILRGDIEGLTATGSIGGAFCEQDDLPVTENVDAAVPETGKAFFYLIRGDARAPMPGSYVDPDGPEGGGAPDSEAGTQGGVDCTHLP